MKELERGDYVGMSEIADVEHTHEIAGPDLGHLALKLTRDLAGVACDQVASID